MRRESRQPVGETTTDLTPADRRQVVQQVGSLQLLRLEQTVDREGGGAALVVVVVVQGGRRCGGGGRLKFDLVVHPPTRRNRDWWEVNYSPILLPCARF